MSPKKLSQKFLADAKARADFLSAAARLPLYALVMGSPAHLFDPDWVIEQKGGQVVFPLSDPDFQLQAIEVWLFAQKQRSTSHPTLVYAELSRLEKKLSRKKSPGKTGWLQKIRTWKTDLPVSAGLSGLSERELAETLLHEMQDFCLEVGERFEEQLVLEAELEHMRSPTYLPEEQRQEQQELLRDLRKVRERLRQEEERSANLSVELESVRAEQKKSALQFQALLSKADMLLGQNRDLTQLCEALKGQADLRTILSQMRERINRALQAGQNERLLIRDLKAEIAELLRARQYLGRVLYDLGLLYLRVGEKNRALVELRAARELGVEEKETNQLLGLQG